MFVCFNVTNAGIKHNERQRLATRKHIDDDRRSNEISQRVQQMTIKQNAQTTEAAEMND